MDSARGDINRLLRHDEIDASVDQRAAEFFRPIDDRLFMHVETRIDENWNSGAVTEAAQDAGEERIVGFADDLRPRRVVDMDDRRNARAIPAVPRR